MSTEFIHELTFEALPEEVVHMARRCLVDTFAIWVSGISTKPSRVARNHAAKRYPGSISLPFDGRNVNPVGYAFAGAASIDAIDGHDGHQICKGHASAALVPALLAEMGEHPACTLDDMLTHLVVGEEIAIRSGMTLHATVPDYHSSGSWNSLGCTAIAARLRGLSGEQTAHALGIAEYYGPRAQMMRCIDHPTMVKDSSSWGALVGISAADLAEDGFTGAPAITCISGENIDFWRDLGQRWRILETNFKAYPACRWAHPAIESVLALTRAHGVGADDIDEIIVSTFHEATRLTTSRPIDGDAAQYSLPLVVASAFLHDTVLPEHLLPENYDRSEIWQLVDKIVFRESDVYNAAFPEERCADVIFKLKSGQSLSSDMKVARGNYDAPLPDDEILQKLEHYASPLMDEKSRQKVAAVLNDLSNAPSPAELVSLLNPGNSARSK
ncbi:MAG: MmgE/PrpD family protein [Pseudomonadota bacterium]